MLPDNSSACGRAKLLRGGGRLAALRESGALDAAKPDGASFLSLKAQEAYAFLLSVEGHCGFADRAKHLLWMGPALFQQESFCAEYYLLAAVPWVHYVPVSYDLESLPAAAAWARANPADVQTIAANGRTFAARWLTSDAVVAYYGALVAEMANLTTFDVAPRPGDGFVDARDYLSNWRAAADRKAAAEKKAAVEKAVPLAKSAPVEMSAVKRAWLAVASAFG